MNRYGTMAHDHWRRWLPARYRTIPDPDSYFSTLGVQVADQIDTLAARIAGPDEPGEGYLAKVDRLRGARRQAEEIILAEQVLLPPETDPDDRQM